jgi:hypothetical protein
MMLVIEHVVGYMLKVLKSGRNTSTFKDEFNAIKHGDYREFLKLVGGTLPCMITWNSAVVKDDTDNPNYECDFEGLFKSGPSLNLFFEKCVKTYGVIDDIDIPQNVYHKAVTFEIAIRMHAKNYDLLSIDRKFELVEVIDILCKFKAIPQNEVEKLHTARRFINMIKHNKQQFPTWTEGVQAFLIGFSVLEKHKLLIV